MEPLKIATVQFETRDNDKVYNLSIIRDMCRKASVEGADVVAFHECSVCGYTFAKDLSREELLAIAEPIPTGESTQALIAIAKEFGGRTALSADRDAGRDGHRQRVWCHVAGRIL